MARSSPEAEDHLDAVFRALGDRTRRSLLRTLAGGDASVSELAEPFELSLVMVSKHLKVLERARLIERTVEGRVRRCSLTPEPLREVSEWVESYREFWDHTLDALANYIEGRDSSPDPDRECEP